MERICIGLLIEDGALCSAIEFALSVEGFEPVRLPKMSAYVDDNFDDCTAIILDVANASFEAVSRLQRSGFAGERVLVLATAPSLTMRSICKKLGAEIIEKPLLGNELVTAIRRMVHVT
jgi:hypothetical protein